MISLSQTLQGLRWDEVPGDDAQKVAARGILYLLIFQQLGLFLRWSWGYNVLLAPPHKFEEEGDYSHSRTEQGRGVYRDEPEQEQGREQEDWQDQDQEQGQEQWQEQEQGQEDGLTRWGSNGTRYSFLHRVGNGSIDGINDVAPRYRRESHTQSDLASEPMIRHHRVSSVSEAVPTTEIRSYPTAEPQVAPADIIVMNADGTDGSTTSGSSLTAGETDSSTTSDSSTGPATSQPDRQSATGLKRWSLRTWETVQRAVSRVLTWMRIVSDKIFGLLPDPMRRVITTIFTGTRSFLRGLRDFMNPPLFAILLAILVASVPSLQQLFFSEGNFVRNSVTRAISQCGDVAIPLILVVLGANLAKNTVVEEPKLHPAGGRDADNRKLLVASLVSRMVLPTIVMAPLLALVAKKLSISILGDPIFIVVCFLLSGAPSALQLAQICQINGVYVGVMSELLFQSYVVWYVSIGVYARAFTDC